MDTCTIDDCDNPVKSRGLCGKHYERVRRYGDPHAVHTTRIYFAGATCAVDTCDTPPRKRGYCETHYTRWLKHGDPLIVKTGGLPPRPPQPCAVPDCDRQALTRGYCDRHYRSFLKHGDPQAVTPKRGPYPPDAVCIVDDCTARPWAFDWCRNHYELWRKYGDPTVRRVGGTVEQKLARYSVPAPGGCRLWTASLNRAGYGIVTIGKGRRGLAHRVSWEIANGRTIPPGLSILHACDNPRCIAPAHLRTGTHAENSADALARGRHRAGRRQPQVEQLDLFAA